MGVLVRIRINHHKVVAYWGLYGAPINVNLHVGARHKVLHAIKGLEEGPLEGTPNPITLYTP